MIGGTGDIRRLPPKGNPRRAKPKRADPSPPPRGGGWGVRHGCMSVRRYRLLSAAVAAHTASLAVFINRNSHDPLSDCHRCRLPEMSCVQDLPAQGGDRRQAAGARGGFPRGSGQAQDRDETTPGCREKEVAAAQPAPGASRRRKRTRRTNREQRVFAVSPLWCAQVFPCAPAPRPEYSRPHQP